MLISFVPYKVHSSNLVRIRRPDLLKDRTNGHDCTIGSKVIQLPLNIMYLFYKRKFTNVQLFAIMTTHKFNINVSIFPNLHVFHRYLLFAPRFLTTYFGFQFFIFGFDALDTVYYRDTRYYNI